MAAAYTGGRESDPRFTFVYVVFNSYHDEVRAEIDQQSMAFAEDLGAEGIFMAPFDTQRKSFADEVSSYDWPEVVRERIESDGEPIILVVVGRYTTFDPRVDRWAIVWLSDFEGAPYDVKPLFQTLARKTKAGDDVIAYLGEVAERRERGERRSRVARFFAQAGSYVDWKPTIPFIGVGIDVKAILADIAEASRQ